MAYTAVTDVVEDVEALAARAEAALAAFDPDDATDAAIEQLRAELEGVRGDGRALLRELDATQVEDLLVLDDGAATIAAWTWRYATRSTVLALMGRARGTADVGVEIRTGSPRRVVISRDGETLQSIAARELGDWREWPRLLEANADLEAGELAVGTPIVVPERRGRP